MSEIVVPITFDSSGAVSGVGRATREVRVLDGAAQRASTTTGRLAGAFRRLGALPIIAGITSLAGALRTVNQAVRAAGVQQIAERRLEQALRNLGGAASAAAPRLKEVAAEIQRTSNFGDELVISAQSVLLSFREVAGPQGAEMLSRSLVDLAAFSERTGGEISDLNQSAMVLGRALASGPAALRRYGVSMTDTQEAAFKAAAGLDRVRILQEIIADNAGGLAAATVNPMRQMRNAVGDLSEAFGEGLMPAATRAAAAITEFVSNPSVIQFVRSLGTFLGNLAKAFFEVARMTISTSKALVGFNGVIRRFVGGSGGGNLLDRWLEMQVRHWARFMNVLLGWQREVYRAMKAMADFDVFLRTRLGMAVDDATKSQGEWAAAIARTDNEIDRNNKRAAEYADTLADAREEVARIVAEFDALADALADGDGTVAGNAKKAQLFMDRLAEALRTANLEARHMRAINWELADAMARRQRQLEREIQLQIELHNARVSGNRTMGGRGRMSAAERRAQQGLTPGALPGVGGALGAIDAAIDRQVSETERLARVEREQAEARMDQIDDMARAWQGFAYGMGAAFGENAAAFKAVAVAEATIAAYAAASKALAVGGPFGVGKAVALLGIGLGWVGKMRSIHIPGGSSGGGAPSASGTSTAAAGFSGGASASAAQVHVHTTIESEVDWLRVRSRLRTADRTVNRAMGRQGP
jgi:hypothetical protein